ncbi:hypothetical protein, partial [Enterobacter hormaechei]|uniref:hypothetical protein n=1 Tax=Enterobacter hormaechei TaxID=158836 RepID=UPI00203EF7CF
VTIAADRFGFQLRNQNKDNPAAVEPRYKGKTYAITGRITTEACGVALADCSPALPGLIWLSSLHISSRTPSAGAMAPLLT